MAEKRDQNCPLNTCGRVPKIRAKPTSCMKKTNGCVRALPCAFETPLSEFQITIALPGNAVNPPTTPPQAPTNTELHQLTFDPHRHSQSATNAVGNHTVRAVPGMGMLFHFMPQAAERHRLCGQRQHHQHADRQLPCAYLISRSTPVSTGLETTIRCRPAIRRRIPSGWRTFRADRLWPDSRKVPALSPPTPAAHLSHHPGSAARQRTLCNAHPFTWQQLDSAQGDACPCAAGQSGTTTSSEATSACAS